MADLAELLKDHGIEVFYSHDGPPLHVIATRGTPDTLETAAGILEVYGHIPQTGIQSWGFAGTTADGTPYGVLLYQPLRD